MRTSFPFAHCPGYQVVRGFCDFNSRLLLGDATPVTLAQLSHRVLGDGQDQQGDDLEVRGVSHSARTAAAATLAYRVLCALSDWCVVCSAFSGVRRPPPCR